MPDTVTFTSVCVEIRHLYKNYNEEMEDFESYVPAANIMDVTKTVTNAFKKRIDRTVRRHGYTDALEFFHEVKKRTDPTFAAIHFGFLVPLVDQLVIDRNFNQTMSLLADSDVYDSNLH